MLDYYVRASVCSNNTVMCWAAPNPVKPPPVDTIEFVVVLGKSAAVYAKDI